MRSSQATDFEAGFTLLELLTVLSIVALVLALAFPRLGGTSARASLQGASLQLAAQLRACRAEALRTNRDVGMTIDISQHTYSSDVEIRAARLARTIEVSMTGAGVEWLGDQVGRIRFRPDGGAGAVTVFLRDGMLGATITVDWLTGATHLDMKT